MEAQAAQQYAAMVKQQLSALLQRPAGAADGPGRQPRFAADSGPVRLSLRQPICPRRSADATFEENLERLGYVDRESPAAIRIYAATFADKDAIADEIASL